MKPRVDRDIDFDGILAEMGVNNVHPYSIWSGWCQLPDHFIKKAVKLGALVLSEKRGPRGGTCFFIPSAEAWQRLAAWRASLALGVRMVRSSDLR